MRTFDNLHKAAKKLAPSDVESMNAFADRMFEEGHIRHRFVRGWHSEWIILEDSDWWKIRDVRGEPEVVSGPHETKKATLGGSSGSFTDMDGVYAIDDEEDLFAVRHDAAVEQGWVSSDTELTTISTSRRGAG